MINPSISPKTIAEALHVRFRLVDGLEFFQIGEPKTIQRTPMIYTLLFDYEPTQSGQVLSEIYTFMHRLVLSFANPEQAELQLMGFVPALQHVIEADPMLDGTLESGASIMDRGQPGFTFIANTPYRIVDFKTRAVVKRPIQRGI